MDYSSFRLGGGSSAAVASRPVVGYRRVAETAPPPRWGVVFFDAWLLGTCRPRRRRRRMRLLLVVIAPPRGSSVRVDCSSAALGRVLFRRAPSWFFYLSAAPTASHAYSCGFWAGLDCQKNQSLSGQRSRCWVKTIITTRTLSLHRTAACETDRDSPAAETAAHTRLHNSARDEGRATQRSNG